MGKFGDPATRFKPGKSGNPNGRVSMAKAFAAIGTSAAEVTAEVLDTLLRAVRELNPKNKDENRVWFQCADKLLAYAAGKPKETVEVKTTLTDEEYAEECRLIARETIRAMPPEERMKLLADPEPTDTIQ